MYPPASGSKVDGGTVMEGLDGPPRGKERGMRRTLFLLTLMAAALVMASGAAMAMLINCPAGGNPCLGTPDADVMNGTSGDDLIKGRRGGDTLNADAGFDQLSGERGEDILNGEADNDTLTGGRDRDTLDGGADDDTYVFADGWGKDTLSDTTSGAFGERLTFSLVTKPVKMDLIQSASRPEARSGNNTLDFAAAVTIVEVDGGSSGDTIRGQNDADSLNGIQGSDTVNGRGGVDTVTGMDGDDTLVGGSGGDTFDAGPGADEIKAADNEADQIDCGGGNDTVFFDQGIDTFVNAAACEDKRPA